MDTIQKTLHRFCDPNPQTIKDPVDRSLLLKRNKLLLSLFSGMLIAHPIFLLCINISFQRGLMMYLFPLTNFLVFFICCRSYIWAYHLFISMLLTIFPLLFINIAKEVAFLQIGHTLVIPVFVLMMTSQPRYMLMALSTQLYTAIRHTKGMIKDRLLDMDADLFIDKFVNSTLVLTFVVLILFSIIIHVLNKRTRELEAANRLAQGFIETQKMFIFNFSHEMRNPLNSLLGNLQLILMGTVPTHVREMVITAQTCAELLLQQINNILDTGKCDIGSLEINLAPTQVHEVLQRTWTVFSELIIRKNLKSCFLIQKKVPPVLLLDCHRISQIMMNLLGNAIKFTDRGSLSVSVKWLENQTINDKCFEPVPYDDTDEGLFEKEEGLYQLSMSNSMFSPGFSRGVESEEYLILNKKNKEFIHQEGDSMSPTKGVLKISISDTGCGMSAESLGQLFQRFSQVSSDPSKRQIGTGLGLYITKEICKKMEGEIRVYSKLGVGTTFIVCIPMISVANQANHLQKSLHSMLDILSRKKLQVIIADDSPLNVTMLENYWAKIGAKNAKTAMNGEEAVKLYKQSCEMGRMVDVVTLDIDMPKMNGKLACQKIREYEQENKLKPAKILLISGNYEEDQVLNHLNRKGADCFLKKPVKFEEFSMTVYKLIEGKL